MTDSDVHVEALETESAWADAYPVICQLRTHLSADEFLDAVRTMRPDGYRLFGLYADEDLVAVTGVAVQYNMYYGRHVWVYELVTDEAHRSLGYGERLLSFVEEWAREQDCEALALSSGLQRTDAHRFYDERTGLERASYVYKQTLD